MKVNLGKTTIFTSNIGSPQGDFTAHFEKASRKVREEVNQLSVGVISQIVGKEKIRELPHKQIVK